MKGYVCRLHEHSRDRKIFLEILAAQPLPCSLFVCLFCSGVWAGAGGRGYRGLYNQRQQTTSERHGLVAQGAGEFQQKKKLCLNVVSILASVSPSMPTLDSAPSLFVRPRSCLPLALVLTCPRPPSFHLHVSYLHYNIIFVHSFPSPASSPSILVSPSASFAAPSRGMG